MSEQRIDKWLWCVRLYPSRSVATAACHDGRVRIGALSVKPSRPVRPGDLITAFVGEVTRTVKVVGIIDRRVGAKHVPTYCEDLTPAAEFQKARDAHAAAVAARIPGGGRPTKKQRRALELLQGAGDSGW